MTAPQRKQVQSEERSAHWMNAYGIRPDERLAVTKEQLQPMQWPNKPLKVQLWATGMLHSPGYAGELAQTTVVHGSGETKRKQVVPLTAALIAHELATIALRWYTDAQIDTDPFLKQAKPELLERFPEPRTVADNTRIKIHVLRWPKQDLRQAMEELEDEGLLERRAVDGRLLREMPAAERRRLPSGSIRLFFYLRPRPFKREIALSCFESATSLMLASNREVGNKSLPPSPSRVLNFFGVLSQVGAARLKDEEYQKKVALAYDAAKKIFLAVLEVPEVGNKSLPQGVPPALPDGASPALPEVVPTSGCIETVTTKRETATAETASDRDPSIPVSTIPAAAGSSPDVQIVFALVSQYGSTTQKACADMIDRCRQKRADVSAHEILAQIEELAARIDRSIRRPVGFLLTQVPEHISGRVLEFRRRKAASETAEAQRAAEIEEWERRQQAELALDDQRDAAWERMPDAERLRRLNLAKAEMRADPNWPNLTSGQRTDRVETRAKQQLLTEIKAGQAAKGAKA